MAAAAVGSPGAGARVVAQSKLVVSVSGSGVVSSGDGKLSCPEKSCSALYDPGTLVDLTASPAKGMSLEGWTGAAAAGCGAKPACTVQVTANPTTIGATFRSGSPPGHTLPPPFVQILSPEPNDFLDQPATTVRGTVDVHTVPFRFCLVVDDRGPPDVCDRYDAVNQTTTPWSFRVPLTAADGLHPGFNTVTAWLFQSDGQASSWFVNIEVASPANGIDLRTVTIEATQGSQFWNLPFPPDATSLSSVREATYNGVRLARGGRTVARVYANAISTGRAGHRLTGVRMLLYGYRTSDHRLLGGSPLSPIAGPATLGTGPSRAVPLEVRSDARGAYTFDLPYSWTSEASIELVATVNPPDLAPAIPECHDCVANNTFRLLDLRFTRGDVYDVFPVKIVWTDSDRHRRAPPADSREVFSAAATMTPAAEGAYIVHPYAVGELDVTRSARESASGDDRNGEVFAALFQWQWLNVHAGFVLGVNEGLARGVTAPVALPAPIGYGYLAVVDSNRPKTSVAHEFWHMLGTVHASNCSPRDPSGVTEPWPPDQRGYLEGYGLDRRGADGSAGPYRIMGQVPVGSNWYDFMSYCANGNDSDSWISTRNWDRRLRGGGEQTTFASRPVSRVAVGPTLEVTGLVAGDGSLRLLHVGPGASAETPSDQASPYSVTVRDGAGGVVSRVGVTAQHLHIDHSSAETRFFAAQIPAPGAASVQVTGPAGAQALRTASANAPTAAVLAPKAGSRVGTSRTVVVRWRATDADGDALATTVDYSTNDGAVWKTLTVDATGTSYAFPRALFARSARGRVRVRVGDGFHETTAVSGRFTAVGSPPVVHILNPLGARRIPADANLSLAGQAFDDASRLIAKGRLRWYDGRRLVARGAEASLVGLRPGRHLIRLRATDGTGRSGTATVTVRVTAVRPALLGLRPPARLSPTARRLVLRRLAATVDATLRAGGRSYRLRRAYRTVSIPIRPGRRTLVVPLRLSAGNLSSSVLVRIPRGG